MASGELFEPAMDERGCHRPLPDCRGDALRRPAAQIAGGEQAGNRRLEHERVAVERPPFRTPPVFEQGASGEDEAGLIDANACASRP